MFSETVDTVINRSKRPDRLIDCVNFVNNSIRQLHGLHYFGADSREERLYPREVLNLCGHHDHPNEHLRAGTQMLAQPGPIPGIADPAAFNHLQYVGGQSYFRNNERHVGDMPFVWRHPTTLRKIDAVRYDGNNIAKFQMPSRQQAAYCHYYYRSGDNHVFVGWKIYIDLYLYVFPPYMQYYKQNERHVRYDRATDTVLYRISETADWRPTLGSATADEKAYASACDWMLIRWNELVVQHALAQLFVMLQDERAAQTNALVQELQKTMVAAEVNYANGVS